MSANQNKAGVLAYSMGFTLLVYDGQDVTHAAAMEPGFFTPLASFVRRGDVIILKVSDGVTTVAVTETMTSGGISLVSVAPLLRADTAPQLPAGSPAPAFFGPARGCICPPKAEDTCRALSCGRRGIT